MGPAHLTDPATMTPEQRMAWEALTPEQRREAIAWATLPPHEQTAATGALFARVIGEALAASVTWTTPRALPTPEPLPALVAEPAATHLWRAARDRRVARTRNLALNLELLEAAQGNPDNRVAAQLRVRARELIGRGANLRLTDDLDGNTALHHAARQGDRETIFALIRQDFIEAAHENHRRQTADQLAEQMGQVELARQMRQAIIEEAVLEGAERPAENTPIAVLGMLMFMPGL